MKEKIKKVLVLGAGPIVIGQAAEFDYSGSQACTALREEGIEVVLVNSNPATIQTDIEIADIVYIEPLKAEFIERIIAQEKVDGILGTVGGQTGLNLTMELARKGILEKYNVKVLGTSHQAIDVAEDRAKFCGFLKSINEPYLESEAVNNIDSARRAAKKIGFPVILRPGFTLGGTGGGVASGEAELEELVSIALKLSPVGQVLLEKSVAGWAEIEYEVVRDSYDNCITICNMENFDPMGVHTGESIVIAPSQTLSDNDYQKLRSASIRIIQKLDIRGSCNIQFSFNQQTGEYYVIEVNPRLSRSSALASKATGYPIARVAAKIAIGLPLHEIKNAITKTPASFEPALDYIVTKIPRWPFDKMPEASRKLGTQMKSTGEVMAIGRTFEESLLKAMRSLEIRKPRLMPEKELLLGHLTLPSDLRLFAIFERLRNGMATVEEISGATKINPWFLHKINNIVRMEKRLRQETLNELVLMDSKRMGLSDARIAELTDSSEEQIREMRKKAGILSIYKMVDTCAAEFEAKTPYYYSTYERENESTPSKKRKVVVIGSGPIRIGQGIEFDYCCSHCAFALKEMGVEAIMVNNNPETVSTDFDTSDKLYFEPLTFEDVMNIIEYENAPVIVQFGGQTSINLATKISGKAKILGTQLEGIDIAEDRERFRALLNELKIPQPENATATSRESALESAHRVTYPVVVRPSYVIAGRGMQIVYSDEELGRYIKEAVEVSEARPVLIDKYLENAIECEIDGVSDGRELFIGGIMEHIEKAGVHSGDASCVTPPVRLSAGLQKTIIGYSNTIALALSTIGMINIQYAVKDDIVYVLEANPRASRTAPYLSKAIGIPLVKIATQLIMGKTLRELGLHGVAKSKVFAVKNVVFPFQKLKGVDFVLGPEMKSTGESMGMDYSFGKAFYKAMLGANVNIPSEGLVVVTLNDESKPQTEELAQRLHALGFSVGATRGTAGQMGRMKSKVEILKKVSEGEPNIVTRLKKGEVAFVINTPSKGKKSFTDGYKIRREAIDYNVPCITTIEGAMSIIAALEEVKKEGVSVKSIVDY